MAPATLTPEERAATMKWATRGKRIGQPSLAARLILEQERTIREQRVALREIAQGLPCGGAHSTIARLALSEEAGHDDE